MEMVGITNGKASSRLLRWGLVGCVLLAAALRVMFLGSIPPGLWFDEALYAMGGLSLQKGPWPIFFATEGRPHEPLYVYSLGAFFALFGHSVLKARIVSAIWGTLSVAAFYPFARRVLGSRWGLAATGAMAVFRWHVHFSRTIFRAMLPPLFILLVAVFFLRWRERRRTADAVACGFFLGGGLYTYLSFRLVPVILLCWIGWLLWRGVLVWRRDWRGLAVIHATALIVFLPLGIDYARNPWHFSGRTDEVSMFRKKVEVQSASGGVETWEVAKSPGETAVDLARNALDVARMWTIRGDHVGKHNLPYAPVFDWASGLLFYAGLGWCVWQIARNEYAFLLLCWLFLMCMTSVFSFGAPNLLRMQGAIPAVVCIYVLGLRWLHAALAHLVSRALRRGIVLTLLAFFAAMQLWVYFVKFPKSPDVRREFLVEMFHDPANAVRQVASEVDRVYVPEEMALHPTFAFITYGLPQVVAYGPKSDLPTSATAGSTTALLVTARSQQLARESGNDPLAWIAATQNAQLLRSFEVAVPDHEGAPAGSKAKWAELWVAGNRSSSAARR